MYRQKIRHFPFPSPLPAGAGCKTSFTLLSHIPPLSPLAVCHFRNKRQEDPPPFSPSRTKPEHRTAPYLLVRILVFPPPFYPTFVFLKGWWFLFVQWFLCNLPPTPSHPVTSRTKNMTQQQSKSAGTRKHTHTHASPIFTLFGLQLPLLPPALPHLFCMIHPILPPLTALCFPVRFCTRSE